MKTDLNKTVVSHVFGLPWDWLCPMSTLSTFLLFPEIVTDKVLYLESQNDLHWKGP